MEKLQIFTSEFVAQQNNRESAWIVMNDKVYDVTKFLAEHPGGEEVILELAGQDATESFDDVGHSTDARKMAEDYLIGVLPLKEKTEKKNEIKKIDKLENLNNFWDVLFSPTWSNLIIPVIISIGIYVLYKFSKKLF